MTDPQKFQEYQQAQNQLSGALGRLLVTVERYPELKSNANFLALQSQLEGTENRIAVARRDYIGTVREYNTELRTIPGRWIAAIFYPDAKPMETFAASSRGRPAAAGEVLARPLPRRPISAMERDGSAHAVPPRLARAIRLILGLGVALPVSRRILRIGPAAALPSRA